MLDDSIDAINITAEWEKILHVTYLNALGHLVFSRLVNGATSAQTRGFH